MSLDRIARVSLTGVLLAFGASCGAPADAPSSLSETGTGATRTLTRIAQVESSGGVAGNLIPGYVEAAAAAITAERIETVVAEIADDRYAGRAPGSTGDALTQLYIAEQLEDIGFEAAGPNGSWFQAVELVAITTAQPPSWRFIAAEPPATIAAVAEAEEEGISAAGPIPTAIEFEQGEDFIVASGVQQEIVAVDDAELVFVGYGIQAPEYAWDDFKGFDLEGKVLVMLNNDPDWDIDLFAGRERLYYGRWTYKYESAARQGAAGAIIVHTEASAGYPWQVVQASWTGTQFELPPDDEPRLAFAGWVAEEAARALVDLAGRDLDALVEQAKSRDFVPLPLGIRTSLELRNAIELTQTANVIGKLEGSDPALADELVIYTAHHDHLGVGEPNAADPDDPIYNGARDNASGVGMVLAIGSAFSALPDPPRRSVMLLFPAAEEQGLLGSEHFAANPPVPAGQIAVNVNFDSGNIWGETRDITFIGLGKSSLDAVAHAVAAHTGRILKADGFPDRGSYYRSDQLNFAKIGVPAFYFASGEDFIGRPAGWGAERIEAYTANDYHQPSDELDENWDFAGMVQDARFGFFAGWLVANDDELPNWNPGSEFEAARTAALEAVEAVRSAP